MLAETAYNVIQSLPESELKRLYGMLRVEPLNKEPVKRKKKISAVEAAGWTKESVSESFLAKHNKKR